MQSAASGNWLALMIGNSRLHWAWFADSTLQRTWDTPHASVEAIAPLTHHPNFSRILGEVYPLFPSQAQLPLWLASVVPEQTRIWQAYAKTQIITLDQVPLQSLYPSFGIDRALAVWGAGQKLGFPVLVIDAGTALTLTGADSAGRLVGGAILPGVGLQLRSLANYTAALPELDTRLISSLQSIESIPRWATNTSEAMLSGVLYSMIAGLQDFLKAWLQTFPSSPIVMTGGDRTVLFRLWQEQMPQITRRVKLDANLVFWGMQAIVEAENPKEVAENAENSVNSQKTE
ncbi:MAG TPA: pantothenate kinase [Allocoleopsis sp.]